VPPWPPAPIPSIATFVVPAGAVHVDVPPFAKNVLQYNLRPASSLTVTVIVFGVAALPLTSERLTVTLYVPGGVPLGRHKY
jgi:hypothetical protein